jgi:hypothetical protein
MVTLDQAKVILAMHEVTAKSPRYRKITDLMFARGYKATAGAFLGWGTMMTAEELDDLAESLEREWVTRWQMEGGDAPT